MNRLMILAISLSVTSLLNCTKFNDSNAIDVRYEFINQTKFINWTLNDGKNTYYIQFDYNYITTENKINELQNNRIVDSVTIISDNNQKDMQEVINLI